MRVFVTGGSGFVGGHVVESLAAQHEIFAMARSDRSAAAVSKLGATPIRCALGDVSAAHLCAPDVVIHCAAFVEEWGTRGQFWTTNVGGTTRLLSAAKEAGAGRFIHIGTEAVLFDGHDLVDVNETQPYPTHQIFPYSESKAEAERRVLAANSKEFLTLSLRPRFVWGPRDNSVLPAILRMLDDGQWRWIDEGRYETSSTHVMNLVFAIEKALSLGVGGEAYFILDNERRTLKQMLTSLVGTTGRTLPERSIRSGLAVPVARLVEWAWRTFRLQSTPPMTRFAVTMMSHTITLKDDKARRDLGYAPVMSIEDGMRQLQIAHQAPAGNPL